MKILLSAFACEPNKGSEFAVGWHWSVALSCAGHDVVVLTRSESRPAIEKQMPGRAGQPRFVYVDVPEALRWQSRGPLHAHAALWQWQAARRADELHRRERFDCVHHVTYAGMRTPSFMGKLGIPFIFGPVGGGERAPWPLRRGYSLGGRVMEMARDAANLAIRFSPVMSNTFASADRIYVTSTDTMALMPPRYRAKASVELAIGSDDGKGWIEPQPQTEVRTAQDGARVLYAGRFVDCKGMHLGLPAFARLAKSRPDARLTVVGEGPAERRWRRMATALGLDGRIDWRPWQSSDAMTAIYRQHDMLLFPALHDSGGLVVLEAMRQGLPVVCLKLGGPATLVDESCGRSVDTRGRSAPQVVEALAVAMVELSREAVRRPLSDVALTRGRGFSWQQKVQRIYGASP